MQLNPVGTDCYNGAITGDVAATLGTPGSSVNASGPTVMQTVAIQDVRAVNKAQNGRGWNDDGTAYTVDAAATQDVLAPTLAAGGYMRAIAPCVTNGPFFSRTGNERVEAEAMVVQPYEVGNCLTARMYKGINSTVDEGQTPVIQPISSTEGCHSIGANENATAAVMQPIALQDITPREKAQNGRGWNDDGTAYTVDTAATQGVAQVAAVVLAPTLTSSNDPSRSPQSSEITAQVAAVVQATGVFFAGQGAKAGSIAYDQHIAPTLKASDSGTNRTPSVHVGMQVRRLTPVECERLQGFPDGYTNIPWRKKLESPDGPRYKALGNSWAVPVVRWIGQRIADHLIQDWSLNGCSG